MKELKEELLKNKTVDVTASAEPAADDNTTDKADESEQIKSLQKIVETLQQQLQVRI